MIITTQGLRRGMGWFIAVDTMLMLMVSKVRFRRAALVLAIAADRGKGHLQRHEDQQQNGDNLAHEDD